LKKNSPVIVAVGGVLAAVGAGAAIAQSLRDDIQKLESVIQEKFKTVEGTTNERFKTVDEKIKTVEGTINEKIKTVEGTINERFKAAEGTTKERMLKSRAEAELKSTENYLKSLTARSTSP